MGLLARLPQLVATISSLELLVLAAAYIALAGATIVLQQRFASLHRRAIRSSDRTADDGSYQPSVDVVVPCFNEKPEMLRECLESLASQEYGGDLQVWMVDDGSSNLANLYPIYKDYQVRFGWKLTTLQRNIGKRLAQDEAVRRSHGELVVSVDSDTVVSPRGIRNL